MVKTKQTIESRIAAIEERNKRVEADKAWETSAARKLSIIVVTYVTVVLFLITIDNDAPFINAIVPCIGFFLSTLTVGYFKRGWVDRRAQ